GVDVCEGAWTCDAGGADVAEGVVCSGIERGRGGGGFSFFVGGAWGLGIAGDVFGVDDLEGFYGAADVGVGAGVDGVPDADVGYDSFRRGGGGWGLRGDVGLWSFRSDGNQGRDVELRGRLDSSGLHRQFERRVGGMLKAEGDGVAG